MLVMEEKIHYLMTLSEASMVQSWLLLKPMILYGTMLFMVTVVMCCTDFAASPVPGNGILSSMRLPSLPRNSFSSSLWYSCMILPCSLTQVRLAWLHCHHCETTHTLWKKDYLAWWCVHVYLLWLLEQLSPGAGQRHSLLCELVSLPTYSRQ